MFLLSVVFAAPTLSVPDAHVVMPWNRFEELYQKGLAPEDPPQVAPRDFTLDTASYTGRVAGEGDDAYAQLRATVRGQVHKREGWTAVPLLAATTALRSAKVNGKDGAIYIQDGFYTLLLDKPGAFTVDLDFAASLTHAEADTFVSFQLAPSGATTVSFAVETADILDFTVANARGETERTVGNVHQVEAALPSNGSLTVSWQREVSEDKAAQLSRVYAETQTLIGVSEGVAQARSQVNYTVLHKGVQSLRFRLPPDATLLEVAGPGIRDWTQAKDGVVSVALTYEALGAYRLTVDYERGLAGGALPLLGVLDVTREKTWIGVDARSAVELVAGAAQNATPVDVRELPAALVGQTDFPVLLAWKSRGGEVVIPLEVKTHPDVDMLVTLLDTVSADTLITPDGRRMTRVRYAVRNNRNQFLRLAMPDGAEIWSASVAGRGVKVAKGEGGVLLPLVRSDASTGALSAFLVELVYVESGAALGTAGNLRLSLPRADAPASQLQWTVYVPEQARVAAKSFDGSIRKVDWFSGSPQLPSNAVVTEDERMQVQQMAEGQMANTLGQGVEPVEVELPLSGTPLAFEKLLVLDEELWVSFEYRVRR